MNKEYVISYELPDNDAKKDNRNSQCISIEEENNIRQMVKKVSKEYTEKLNNMVLKINYDKKEQLDLLIKLMNEVAFEWYGKLTIRYDEKKLFYSISLNGDFFRFEKDKSKLFDIINNADDIEFYTTNKNNSNIEIFVTKSICETTIFS